MNWNDWKEWQRQAANEDRIIRSGRKADRLIFFVLAIPVWVYLLILIFGKVFE